jgi:RNA polymerase sigma-70 factor (ECF subfamily)
MTESDHSSSEEGAGESRATSLTLLQKVQGGDAAGWQRLCAVYTPLVRWWCHARGVGATDAEDVAQEVFVTVLGQVSEFNRAGHRGSFRAWLRKITHYKVLEFFRRNRRQPVGAGGSDALGLLAEVPEGPADGEETEHTILVRAALEGLRTVVQPTTWEAAARTLLGGESPQEAAAALGLSVNAVYIARARVLGKLREELAELLD